MDQIARNNARAEISKRVQHILNKLQIKDWTSEPHNKNQNFAKCVWRDVKRMTETTLNFSDAPAYVWLLALEYVCFVKNHTASEQLGGRTPAEWLLGFTPDITALLCFIFWEPVYYAIDEGSFPETPDEALGRFVGIADCVGNSCFLQNPYRRNEDYYAFCGQDSYQARSLPEPSCQRQSTNPSTQSSNRWAQDQQ